MAIFVLVVILLADKFRYFMYFNYALSAILIIAVLRSDEPPIYKMSWVIPLLIAPVFGGLFYLTFKPIGRHRKLAKRHLTYDKARRNALLPLIKEPTNLNNSILKQIRYLSNDVWPYYKNTQVEFLPSGEAKLFKVLEELKKAEKSIFIEYFILEESGNVWKEMYPILVEKPPKVLMLDYYMMIGALV